VIHNVVSVLTSSTIPVSSNTQAKMPPVRLSRESLCDRRDSRRSRSHVDRSRHTRDTRNTGNTGNTGNTRDDRNTRDPNLSASCLLRAVTGDVARFTALVASLTGGVKRTAVGGGAVPRDVTELSTSIALHGLSLAVTGKVVGATALVASRRASATSETTAAETASKSSTAGRRTTGNWSASSSGVRA
jgi:hypothetical protein